MNLLKVGEENIMDHLSSKYIKILNSIPYDENRSEKYTGVRNYKIGVSANYLVRTIEALLKLGILETINKIEYKSLDDGAHQFSLSMGVKKEYRHMSNDELNMKYSELRAEYYSLHYNNCESIGEAFSNSLRF